MNPPPIDIVDVTNQQEVGGYRYMTLTTSEKGFFGRKIKRTQLFSLMYAGRAACCFWFNLESGAQVPPGVSCQIDDFLQAKNARKALLDANNPVKLEPGSLVQCGGPFGKSEDLSKGKVIWTITDIPQIKKPSRKPKKAAKK